MKKMTILLFNLVILTCYINAQETITDIDGNIYQTVTIGNQVWMKENLKTTHYRNGEAIPLVENSNSWKNLTTGAYCNYNNDSLIAAIYGRLYNWYTVADTRKVCPHGWHVPGETEWFKLSNYLGGQAVAGGKMKDTVYWNSPNTGANNSSGFSGLPGGARVSEEYGNYINLGTRTDFWSSTKNTDLGSWAQNSDLHYDNARLYCGNGASMELGFSVRCIMDSIEPVNHDPCIIHPIPDLTCKVDSLFIFTIPDSAFVDKDGNETLTFSSKQGNGTDLPGWLEFDNKTFTGCPPEADFLDIQVTVTDTAKRSASDIFRLTIENYLAIRINKSDKIKIFPNPAQNTLQIEYPGLLKKEVNYKIIDLSGKTLQQGKLNGNEINVSKRSKDNYLLSLNIEGETLSKKFVIE